MGEEGFRGASSLLYHRRSPSAITGVEPAVLERSPLSANDPLLPWHLRARSSERAATWSPAARCCSATATSPSAGRADPVERAVPQRRRRRAGLHPGGAGRMESVFGRLGVAAGDYVVVPASTTHRWVVDANGRAGAVRPRRWCSRPGHVGIPARYLTATGQLREGAPFCERDLRAPEGPWSSTTRGPRCSCGPGRGGPATATPGIPSTWWVGRLRLPLRPRHLGLRADRRSHPPTAAGPPDLRGARVRGVQLRAPALRLRPRGGQGALPPRQRRLRRGALLL